MDILRLEPYEDFEKTIRYKIFINEIDFVDIVREIELPFAMNEANPHLAGDYIGFNRYQLEYDLGSFIRDGEVEILCCGGCGVEECWPIIGHITNASTTIKWSEFYNPHRRNVDHPWDHSALGPFIFDKKQYFIEFTRELNNLYA